MKLEYSGFEKAYSLISKHLRPTPLIRNEWLSSQYNTNIFLKLENLQPVGSFKLRGAFNKLSNLSQEDKLKGILAVSAGNHAQGVAWAAKKLSIDATIIMPKVSPIIKILNTQTLGAQVILKGDNVDQGFKFAAEFLKTNDLVFVHPFCDEDIIYGQGSIGMELEHQIDKIDFLISSIGGGGLATGLASTVKHHFKDCKVIGTQAAGASSMVQSLDSGVLQHSTSVSTFADGIKVKSPVGKMHKLLAPLIDETVEVSDDKIAYSVLVLMEQARVISEGAGAITLAAFDELYKMDPSRFKDKNVVLVVSGGNIDINLVDRIIEKGLIESRRRIKAKFLLEDSPGSLSFLTSKVMDTGANILNVDHDREDENLNLQDSYVNVTLETRGPEHAEKVLSELSKEFKLVHVEVKS